MLNLLNSKETMFACQCGNNIPHQFADPKNLGYYICPICYDCHPYKDDNVIYYEKLDDILQ